MQTKEEILQQIADAYEHLYDIAALRAHPLLRLAAPNSDARARAWQLHKHLLKAIQEIAPGRDAPPASREWRRHRLMQMRYVDVQSVQATAADLSISRRQFYRIHEDAITAIADTLFPNGLPSSSQATPHSDVPSGVRSTLLRTEAARVPHLTFTLATEIARKAAELLGHVCAERHVNLHIIALDAAPALAVDPALFRQLFLGLVDYLLERSFNTSITVTLCPNDPATDTSNVRLCIALSSPSVLINNERISALHEMAQACNVRLHTDSAAAGLRGFIIDIPACDSRRSVLAVDDNVDMLQIYERYLAPHGFLVHTAHDAPSALTLLEHIHPEVIFLDIMLPGQDGWEVLQQLLHRPDGPPARIFVCSVLRQHELALALGAAGYLQKPFTASDLLGTLAAAR